MIRFIITAILTGLLFGVLDGLINANPYAASLMECYKPIAKQSINESGFPRPHVSRHRDKAISVLDPIRHGSQCISVAACEIEKFWIRN